MNFFPIIGNDDGSTGDASSTVKPKSLNAAAASGAVLEQGYDGTPLVCYPIK